MHAYALVMKDHETGGAVRIVAKPDAIADYLKATDISRDELARRMGIAKETAYRVDTGRTEPSPRFIAQLMNVTGLGFDELFVIEGNEQVSA